MPGAEACSPPTAARQVARVPGRLADASHRSGCCLWVFFPPLQLNWTSPIFWQEGVPAVTVQNSGLRSPASVSWTPANATKPADRCLLAQKGAVNTRREMDDARWMPLNQGVFSALFALRTRGVNLRRHLDYRMQDRSRNRAASRWMRSTPRSRRCAGFAPERRVEVSSMRRGSSRAPTRADIQPIVKREVTYKTYSW